MRQFKTLVHFFQEALEYLRKNAVICDPKFKEHV